jgi:DNA repair protein REV1
MGGAVEMDKAVYGASRFGHFGEYMRRKRAKLQIQNADIVGSQQDSTGGDGGSTIFKGLSIYVSCFFLLLLCI